MEFAKVARECSFQERGAIQLWQMTERKKKKPCVVYWNRGCKYENTGVMGCLSNGAMS